MFKIIILTFHAQVKNILLMKPKNDCFLNENWRNWTETIGLLFVLEILVQISYKIFLLCLCHKWIQSWALFGNIWVYLQTMLDFTRHVAKNPLTTICLWRGSIENVLIQLTQFNKDRDMAKSITLIKNNYYVFYVLWGKS
jgi:hypothetical protein